MKEGPPERLQPMLASGSELPQPGPQGGLRGVYLSLGSNQGERHEHLAAGIDCLQDRGIRTVRCSPVYWTEPVGGPEQEDFLNLVIEVETKLSPREVLEAAQAAERKAGRRPGGSHWGPRPLDIDVLLYRETVIDEADFQVPHPRCHLRRFVLTPLADLAPDLTPPRLAQTVRRLLDACADRAAVRFHAPPLLRPGA